MILMMITLIILQLRSIIHFLIILNQSKNQYSMMNQFKKIIEDILRRDRIIKLKRTNSNMLKQKRKKSINV